MKNREEKVKNFRILEIDQLIREGTYPNATSLRKKFEVSRSTIARDIDFFTKALVGLNEPYLRPIFCCGNGGHQACRRAGASGRRFVHHRHRAP